MSQRITFKIGCAALAALFLGLLMSCSRAETPPAEFASAGRGAPVAPAIPWETWRNAGDIEAIPPREITGYPEQHWLVGPLDGPATGNRLDGFLGAARGGAAPAGTDPLKVDIFTSKDFYADRALWTDKRYFRCNSPYGLEQQWRGGMIGDKPPASAAWGFCDRDYPREAIVSPYKFTTAQAHYEALLDEARRRGGPTQHTYATVPGDWSGRYVWHRGQNCTPSCCGISIRRCSRCSPMSTRRGWCRRRITTHTPMRRSGRRSTAGPKASCGVPTDPGDAADLSIP